ncbi:hypothetical protein [Aliidiomarina sp.]|uniref:hypothetical protein n=1 Tax=Aliidiomarina sp. TaxID=1872439 RepID=UPI003A4D9F87
MNYTLLKSAASPYPEKVKQPLQGYQRSQHIEHVGFVMVLPEQNKVYWNQITAKLHNECCTQNLMFDIKQFLQWYQPEQRELLSQSLFVEQQAFQLDVTIAHNRHHLRYCLLPLAEFLQGKAALPHRENIWVGFVRCVGRQPRATRLSKLLQEAVSSA